MLKLTLSVFNEISVRMISNRRMYFNTMKIFKALIYATFLYIFQDRLRLPIFEIIINVRSQLFA